MEITEVRIKLMSDAQDRLLAFCSITFDGSFVIRDLKIIQGGRGIFVAMPSRKLTDHCPRCHCKNHLRAEYCNQCGARLSDERAEKDSEGRAKLYADIAHPINAACREMIQEAVVTAYESEILLSESPEYICKYDDYGEERYAGLHDEDLNPIEEDKRPQSVSFLQGERKHRVDPPARSDSSGGKPTNSAGDRHANMKSRSRQAHATDEFGEGLF
ncbi:SpoVG family protein [Stratiformator vulcanicus]|uniref:Septation protein SpoVG n=1 Tax=Stratiformator vulcanicus TaxID=2527980 RepID=A0A517R2I8_9PLAN|nr:Putative septation protein SpoVG [Stratiformator vulcanicus]